MAVKLSEFLSESFTGYTGSQGIQGIQGLQGVQGVQGRQGIQGIQGTQGVQGIQGSQGPQGTQGIQGQQGIQGIQGVQGTQGPQGTQGIQGPQGTQGIQGNTGIQGIQGIQGSQGTQGIQGIQGLTGIQGIQGRQGIQGITGAQGIQGIQGPQGTQGIQGIQGNTGTQGIQGIQGPQGTQGIQGVQGTQGVQGIQGTQGLQGITGAQGIQGRQGIQGTTGIQGLQGIQGQQGVQGSQGTQGIQGIQGTQGLQGIQGPQGTQGIQGNTGIQGTQGITGSQGIQGRQGIQGIQGLRGSLQWISRSTAYTSVDEDAIVANTSAGSFTINLPAAPTTGSTIVIVDGNGTFATNPLTVGRNASTIEGIADDIVLNISNIRVDFVYNGTTWQVYTTVGQIGFTGSQGIQGIQGAIPANAVLTTGNQTVGGIKTFTSEVIGKTASGAGTVIGSFEATTTGGSFASMYTRRGAPFLSTVVHTGSSYAPALTVEYEYTGLYSGIYSLGHLTTNAANPGNFAIHHINSSGTASQTWLFDGNNGAFTSSGEITAFSDEKLKTNVKDIESPLEKVLNLRGVTFNRVDLDDKDRVYIGVIAQEIEKILPEVVTIMGDGIKSVSYGNIVALLIEAIKELAKKIEDKS